MKKMMAGFAVLLMLASCGKTNTANTTTTPEPSNGSQGTSESAGMANPWSDVESAQEAADGAGVGYFMVPENGSDTSGGPVHIDIYRWMKGLAEAKGSVGTAELTIRKGLKQDSADVSGDYNAYKYSWTVEAGDWTVSCWGNEEGKTMKAVWLSDNFSYSFMVRGQGDLAETYGVDDEAVKTLAAAIQ